MKKFLKINIIITFFIFLFILNFFTTQSLLAQSDPSLKNQIEENLNDTGVNAGYGETSIIYNEPLYIGAVVGAIVSYALGFLGVIFLILIIYSGYQWMTAGGNEETVTKAKKRLTNATIGLIIIFTAFIITYFITEVLIKTTDYGAT